VALQILYRDALKIYSPLCDDQGLGSYRAVFTAYGVALASYVLAQMLDVEAIWATQAIDPDMDWLLKELFELVKKALVEGGGKKYRHIGEWSKKIECWKVLVDDPGLDQFGYLKASSRISKKQTGSRRNLEPAQKLGANSSLKVNFAEVMSVTAETWFSISQWAKDTKNLQAWQRSLAYSMGKLAANGKAPSEKQLVQAQKILDEANRLGFVTMKK